VPRFRVPGAGGRIGGCTILGRLPAPAPLDGARCLDRRGLPVNRWPL